jgi:cellulose synthase/poly-beta-1,6-N-acetylglucosamine synthase-like glycosyltransferase
MKKLMTVLFILLTVGGISAQSLISTSFSDYEENEDYTRVSISKKMFSIMANLDMEDDEDAELLKAVTNLDGLKVIVADSSENPKAMFKEAMSRIPKRFEELMTVNDKDEKIVFLIDEKDGIISELIMVMRGDNEFVLLDMFGKIDLKQIVKLSRKMNIDHLDQLERIEED